MCEFITAAVPAGTDLNRLETVVPDEIRRAIHVVPFSPACGTFTGPALPRTEILFRPTHGMCNCGTSLGEALHRVRVDLRTVEQRRRKYEKLGWSQSRIARAAGAREHARNRQIQPQRADADVWLAFLKTCLDSGLTKRIGLLHHFYRDDSPVAVERRFDRPIADVPPDELRHLEDAVLYRFHH